MRTNKKVSNTWIIAMTKNFYQIPFFDIEILQNNVKDKFLELLNYIRPKWKQEDIIITQFDKGTTNTIYSASLLPLSEINNLEKGTSNVDVVLIRLFGNKTEVIIDRRKEIENLVAMWSIGCGKELYGVFDNGLCYHYAPGIIINTSNVKNPAYYPLIAKQMALMHSSFPDPSYLPTVRINKPTIRKISQHLEDMACLDMLNSQIKNSFIKEPCFFPTIKKWASLILPFFTNNHTSNNNISVKTDNSIQKQVNNFDKSHLLSKLPIDPWKEIDYLESLFIPLKSPIVFCHNDLLLDNIVFDPCNKDVTFIDLEYGDFNFQAFDIAQFFCEFCGLETVNYDLFPSSAFRRLWLTFYWKAWDFYQRHPPSHKEESNNNDNKNMTNEKTISLSKINDVDIETFFDDSKFDSHEMECGVDLLMRQLDAFILGPHLYWGVWALLQSQVSDKAFDFFAYAKIRFNEYARLKSDPTILQK